MPRQPSVDLVQRQFSAEAPNRLWVAHITYLPTCAGFLFLAVVLDAFSRKIVGWAMAEHLRTELVLAALNMALRQRRAKGVVHYSEHGTQYTSIAFGLRCKEAKVACANWPPDNGSSRGRLPKEVRGDDRPAAL
jgi:putative transposase